VLGARYDGLGRRIEVTRHGATVERYVYLPGSFLVLAVLDGSNQVKEIYTHGPDLSGMVGGAGGIGGILAVKYPQQTNAPTYSLHSDALGNIILATDGQGKEAEQYRYSPIGRLLNHTGTFTPRFQYSSKEFDSESGLLNFGYRHLNPRLGRWMERDRIAEGDGPNLYAFVGNDSVGYVDPGGEARLRLPGPVRELPIGNWPPRIPRIPRPTFPSPCELIPNEFVRHYYCGKGQPFDLVARGYLPRLKSALSREINDWEAQAKAACKTTAADLCKLQQTKRHIYKRETIWPNLIFRFFELGNTTFIRTYDLDVTADCRTCNVDYSGELRYTIRDRFADPLDTLNRIPGDFELPGSTPYEIFAHWQTKPFEGSLRFP
jgi:RHS repeat-associated protein